MVEDELNLNKILNHEFKLTFARQDEGYSMK